MSAQRVDLYQPIIASRVGPAPVLLRVAVTPNVDFVAGGVPVSSQRIETYVLASALPEELRERVKLAVQALAAAG